MFAPVKKGYGAELVAKNAKTGKFGAVTGTKDMAWLEASTLVQREDKWDILDKSYHEELARKAIETINQFGSFEGFVSRDGVPF